MGTNYGNVDAYHLFHDPSIPIYFAPKMEDDNKNKSSQKAIDLERKNSNSSESDSVTRKSTVDEEEVNLKKIKNKKVDKFTTIFKNLKHSPLFIKNESTFSDEDDYYLIYNESDNIRKEYYSKLIYKNIWTPGQKAKTHNNLFIFDWDNTLFPTTFLAKEEIIDNNLPEEYIEIFSILEKSIIKIFNLAIDKGDVYIITNSSIGWVEFSIDKYLPNLTKFLDKIHIISSRNEYEDLYPGEPTIWKINAFLNLKKKIRFKFTY